MWSANDRVDAVNVINFNLRVTNFGVWISRCVSAMSQNCSVFICRILIVKCTCTDVGTAQVRRLVYVFSCARLYFV